MAKLSAEVLTEGRRLVLSSDLEGLNAWVRRYAPTVDPKVVSGTFEKVFLAQDIAKGLKIFDAGFMEYDASIERASTLIRMFVPVFLFLGALGGVLYLAHVLMGH